jgi:hypothetical protein
MKIAEAIVNRRDHNKLSPAGIALVSLYAIHLAMIAAVNLGVEVHDPWRAVWLFSVGGPMFVAWLLVVIEELTWHY